MQEQNIQYQEQPINKQQKKENPVAFLKGQDENFNNAMDSINNMYDDLFPSTDVNLNLEQKEGCIFNEMNQLYDNIMAPSEEEKQRKEQFLKEQELKKLQQNQKQQIQFINEPQQHFYYKPNNIQQQPPIQIQQGKQQYQFIEIPLQPQQNVSMGYPVQNNNNGLKINDVNLSTGQVIYQGVPIQPQYVQAQPQFVQSQPQFVQGQPQYIQVQPQFAQVQQPYMPQNAYQINYQQQTQQQPAKFQGYNYPKQSFN